MKFSFKVKPSEILVDIIILLLITNVITTDLITYLFELNDFWKLTVLFSIFAAVICYSTNAAFKILYILREWYNKKITSHTSYTMLKPFVTLLLMAIFLFPGLQLMFTTALIFDFYLKKSTISTLYTIIGSLALGIGSLFYLQLYMDKEIIKSESFEELDYNLTFRHTLVILFLIFVLFGTLILDIFIGFIKNMNVTRLWIIILTLIGVLLLYLKFKKKIKHNTEKINKNFFNQLEEKIQKVKENKKHKKILTYLTYVYSITVLTFYNEPIIKQFGIDSLEFLFSGFILVRISLFLTPPIRWTGLLSAIITIGTYLYLLISSNLISLDETLLFFDFND